MAHSEKERENIVNEVCDLISTGYSLSKACRAISVSKETFYKIIDEDKEKSNQYARATKERAEAIFEEILDIADETENDTIEIDLGDGIKSEKTNHEAIQRSKLRVDARKWMLSKMQPKKYGDKIDMTTGGDKIQSNEINVKIIPPNDEE